MIDKNIANEILNAAKAKTEVEVCQDRLNEARKQKKRLAYVQKMAVDYQAITKLKKEEHKIELRIEKLTHTLSCIEDAQSIHNNASRMAVSFSKDLKTLIRLQKQSDHLESKARRLSHLTSQIVSTTIALGNQCRHVTDSVKYMNKVVGSRCPICRRKLKS